MAPAPPRLSDPLRAQRLTPRVQGHPSHSPSLNISTRGASSSHCLSRALSRTSSSNRFVRLIFGLPCSAGQRQHVVVMVPSFLHTTPAPDPRVSSTSNYCSIRLIRTGSHSRLAIVLVLLIEEAHPNSSHDQRGSGQGRSNRSCPDGRGMTRTDRMASCQGWMDSSTQWQRQSPYAIRRRYRAHARVFRSSVPSCQPAS